MNLIELIIDDKDDLSGVDAISVVENPAIESNFVALKSEEIKLAQVNAEKRILMGAVLIPEKPIYRRNGEDEYYIYFSKDTVNKASQLFFKNGNHPLLPRLQHRQGFCRNAHKQSAFSSREYPPVFGEELC